MSHALVLSVLRLFMLCPKILCFVFVCPVNQHHLTFSLLLSILYITNQNQLWSVLRIAMEMVIVSQEYATVSQASCGLTALEVKTHVVSMMFY